ncbi:MAG: hypothetical protein OXFUSZZB_002011 [Candidatus Fervidibacter sp.]|jgi:hypothetical protein
MWRIVTAIAIITMLLISVGMMLQRTTAQRRQPTVQGMGILHAPDFPPGVQWLNTDRPLSLKALRGKFVLLDFWTYC